MNVNLSYMQCLKTVWSACLWTTDFTICQAYSVADLYYNRKCILLYIFCHTELWEMVFTFLQQRLGSTGHRVARLHHTPNPFLSNNAVPFAPAVNLPRPSWCQTVFRTSLEVFWRSTKSLNFWKVLCWMSWEETGRWYFVLQWPDPVWFRLWELPSLLHSKDQTIII